jgi:hypothetical protein
MSDSLVGWPGRIFEQVSDFAATCPPTVETGRVATIIPSPAGRAPPLIETRHFVPGYLHLVPLGHEHGRATTRDSKVPSKAPNTPD